MSTDLQAFEDIAWAAPGDPELLEVHDRLAHGWGFDAPSSDAADLTKQA